MLRLRNVLGIKTFVELPQSHEKIQEKRGAIADRRQKREDKNSVGEKRQKSADRRKNQWDATFVIVLKLGHDRFGLCVEQLHDIEEVVVEPLSEYVKHLKYFSGATILGDGNVIMILDVQGIASMSSLRFESIKTEEDKRNLSKEKAQLNRGEKRNLIVFCNDDNEYFALPLEHVSRLETINPDEIHHTGDFKYIEHNRTSVFLVSMDELFPAGTCNMDTPEVFAIFPKFISAKVGILASRIVDTIETSEILDKDTTCADAVMGKLFIDEMMVQVLDHEKMATMIDQKVIQAKGKAQ